MKALSITLRSAINQKTVTTIIALVSLISIVYPEISLASNSLQANGQISEALVFEIKNPVKTESQNLLTYDQIAQADPLANLLQQYLVDKGSPLAPYAAQMVLQPNWKKALAISFVESNMCIHQVDNNCSGMGGAPGSKTWRKYKTQLDWFVDLNNLLNKPLYADKYNTFQKMVGVYVQPGSPAWVHGSEQVYAQLTDLEEQAEAQKVALNQQNSILAFATPEAR